MKVSRNFGFGAGGGSRLISRRSTCDPLTWPSPLSPIPYSRDARFRHADCGMPAPHYKAVIADGAAKRSPLQTKQMEARRKIISEKRIDSGTIYQLSIAFCSVGISEGIDPSMKT